MRIKIVVSGGELDENLVRKLQSNYKDKDLKFDIEKVDLSLNFKLGKQDEFELKESELETILKDDRKTKEFLFDKGFVSGPGFLERLLKLDSRKRFFRIMKEFNVSIRTSLPPPEDFKAKFKNYNLYDLIVVSTISSKLSNTYNSAILGVENFNKKIAENIVVIDSKMVSFGVGYSAVRYVQDFLEKGEKIKIKDYSDEVFIRALFFDVSHLIRGGRGIFLRSLLGLFKFYPYVTLKDGGISIVTDSNIVSSDAPKTQLFRALMNCKGEKRMLSKFKEEVINYIKEQEGRMYVNILYGDETMEGKLEGLLKELKNLNVSHKIMSPDYILGTHLGPDFVGAMIYSF